MYTPYLSCNYKIMLRNWFTANKFIGNSTRLDSLLIYWQINLMPYFEFSIKSFFHFCRCLLLFQCMIFLQLLLSSHLTAHLAPIQFRFLRFHCVNSNLWHNVYNEALVSNVISSFSRTNNTTFPPEWPLQPPSIDYIKGDS